jgi:broad specificity phosphatase PhoE
MKTHTANRPDTAKPGKPARVGAAKTGKLGQRDRRSKLAAASSNPAKRSGDDQVPMIFRHAENPLPSRPSNKAHSASVPPIRRALLRTLTIIAARAASALLAGCAATTTPSPAATAGGVATSTVPPPVATSDVAAPATLVMLIRHGEKPSGKIEGVDAQGNKDDSSLTRTGWNRAHRLVDLFDPAQGSPRPGLARPAAIYAAGANDEGEGTRTRETVTPLANRLGIPVDTSFGKGEEEALVEHVITQPGPALISWQHGEIPAIAAAFPAVTPTPPSDWPDDRFDVIWIFTKTADGWRFSQMPELALPDDQASVIEN